MPKKLFIIAAFQVTNFNNQKWWLFTKQWTKRKPSSSETGQIASLSESYVLRVTKPMGAFQLVALSSTVKHPYLVKEVRLI
ncbi:hypothetical protein [[Scytonema hofmanni] UTEX B 1581]|uniref:hypothetical protein n=1 Tax=[Scytonema hofmanni] UTEX B 1581 TaxID=379535 RepID=UPI001184281F|nr:hypothetical protein [[Scytonema hofmanni] UTEX B 1581]